MLSLNYKNRFYYSITDKTYDNVVLENCGYCVISGCKIHNLTLINSQYNTITDNIINYLKIDSTPPTFKHFNKRRRRKWVYKYGSVGNVVSANVICLDEHSPNNIWKID